MRMLLLLLALAGSLSAKCIPIEEAASHIGDTTCVKGKVVKVTEGQSGSYFINFCDDYTTCPFAAVVFRSDLKDVGDVRWLEGREIELHGKIRLYRGQPEIVLRDVRQLRGEAAAIPPAPKDYDAERRGKNSAGEFRKRKK